MSEQNHQEPVQPTPTPEQVAAWADGEASPWTASEIEAWIDSHPDAAREVESLLQVTRLYRDFTAPPPCPRRLQNTCTKATRQIADRSALGPSRRAWDFRLMLGLTFSAAALLGAVVLARSLWPISGPGKGELAINRPLDPEEDDKPFEVAKASDVNIIHMDFRDVDRIVTGQPLMGPIEFVTSGDQIDLVNVQPNAGENAWGRLEQRSGMPMIVVVKADDDE